MGDRCYFAVTLRACDIDRFGKGFEDGWCSDEFPQWWAYVNYGDPDDRSPGSVVELAVNEVNYGGDDIVSAAAKKGIAFYGYHTAGFEYGPQMFAACDGAAIWQDCDSGCSSPVVPADEITGELSPTYLEALKNFVRLRNKAKARIEKGQD